MGVINSKKKNQLKDCEIDALVRATRMSKSEIVKWHRGFMADCPTGRLSKHDLIKIYEQLFPSGRAKRFCDFIFKVFDKNGTNTIACSLTSNAKPEEKVSSSMSSTSKTDSSLANSQYVDASPYLDQTQMQKVIDAVHELYKGVPLNKTNEDDSQSDSFLNYINYSSNVETFDQKPVTHIYRKNSHHNGRSVHDKRRPTPTKCDILDKISRDKKLISCLKKSSATTNGAQS